MGGLFVLHVLFTSPQSFNTYIAASPSIWFNDRAILEEAHAFERQFTTKTSIKLLITVGDHEQHYIPIEEEQTKEEMRQLFTRDPAALCGRDLEYAVQEAVEETKNSRMVDNAKELAEELGKRGVNVEFVDFAGEDHMSEVPPAINRAIKFAWKRPQ